MIDVSLSDTLDVTDSIGFRVFGAVPSTPLDLDVDAIDNVLDTP